MTKPTEEELRKAVRLLGSCMEWDMLSNAITELIKLRKKGESFASLCSLDCDTCADTIQSIKESMEEGEG